MTKPIHVLGINELYHDTSAALVSDGALTAVMEEERLNRVKHAPGTCWNGEPPEQSIQWCLDQAGLRDEDIACAVISYDMNACLAIKTIIDAVICNWRRMGVKNVIRQRIQSGDHAASVVFGNIVGYFGGRRRFLDKLRKRFGRVVEIDHHLCHAASAYRLSGYRRSNIIVVDGLGEDHSTSLYYGDGDRIRGPFRQYSQYQSLGMFYKTVTFMLGFGYFGDGKTMGLSGYGTPRAEFSDIITPLDGDYRIHLSRIQELGRYARAPHAEEVNQDHMDVAASAQHQLEQAALALTKHLYERTGCKNLCLAGGVALNCDMNALLIESPYVDEIFIQPGAMDMGTAIGAALEGSVRLGAQIQAPLQHVYYGAEYSSAQIEAALRARGVEYRKEPDLERTAAQLLSDGKVLGWFQGRMEYGPRALGNRSIVADPRVRGLRDRVNHIKQRDLWRPLAPSVLEHAAGEWFEDVRPTPFMTIVFRFKPEKATLVPAVVHVDGTARVQTVTEDVNPRYFGLIQHFERLTGVPMVLNTSFNRRGEPIVCSPEHALTTFLATDMDYLCIGDYIVSR